MNKLLLKDRVLTAGNGSERVVLDYESSLVYAYHEPENVIAYFEPKKGWIIRDRPYYSSGGWGRGSSGDRQGYALVSNATDLLRSIEARIYEINSMVFLSKTEIKELQTRIKQHNKLVAKQNDIASKLGESRVKVEPLPKIPEFKLNQLNPGKTLKGLDAIKTALVFKTALSVFTERKGKPVKVDAYVIRPDLVMQNTDVVAFRDASGDVFMNSQVLSISSFESKFMGKQSLIQSELRKISRYNIPFNVLASADLKLNETRVLESGPASEHNIKVGSYGSKTESRHFTGALLLENAGRKFLMDIDRREIEHGIFNAFFVEVDKTVKTIKEAYESMVPTTVKEAIASGLKVERQGEWFFIPTDKTLEIEENKVKRWDASSKETGIVLRHNISHGKGRPNSLFKPVGFGELDDYVCSTVEHSGREHAPLSLGETENKEMGTIIFKLWKVVGNTTVSNFTITGDID